MLIILVLIAGGIWAFVEIADEMIEGGTHRIDSGLILAMRSPGDPQDPIGPGWLEELGRDFTALGSNGVLTLLTLSAAGYLTLIGRIRMAILVVFAVGGGFLLVHILKLGFDRPRPELVPREVHVYTASFPSGHSMMSAVAYLTLGALLARVQPKRRVKAYLISLAVLITVLVGVSRIYLGVHWPSDVLAGWTIGATWALVCWFITFRLQRHRRIEP
jgi:undecaprenyl-diphosphatase